MRFFYPALTADPILVTRPTSISELLILLAYKNGDCPAISVPQNESDAQEAPNFLYQVKVCHFQPIEKLACGMNQ